MTAQSNLEGCFRMWLLVNGINGFIPQYSIPKPERLLKARRASWRMDFAWPDLKIAVEINGGTYSKARLGHSTGAGIRRDYDKMNYLQASGWRVFFFDADHVNRSDYYPLMLLLDREKNLISNGVTNGQIL